MTNAAVAEAAGVSMSYLYLITTGARPLHPALAERLAGPLGVTAAEVVAAVDRGIRSTGDSG